MGVETSDFWVAKFADEDAFSEYFGESAEYYRQFNGNFVTAPLKGNLRTEGATPLTNFIGDQGHDWYDTTKGEMAFNATATSIPELVQGCSYSDQWAKEFALKVARIGVQGFNSFCFIKRGIVASPRSVKGTNFVVEYVGHITYQT